MSIFISLQIGLQDFQERKYLPIFNDLLLLIGRVNNNLILESF